MASLEEALAAVSIDGYSLQDCSKASKDADAVVMKAVKMDGGALRFASARLRDSETVVRAAVASSGEALEFASDRLKADASASASIPRRASRVGASGSPRPASS